MRTLRAAPRVTSFVPTTLLPWTVRSLPARTTTESPETVLATPILACVLCIVPVVDPLTRLPRLDDTAW